MQQKQNLNSKTQKTNKASRIGSITNISHQKATKMFNKRKDRSCLSSYQNLVKRIDYLGEEFQFRFDTPTGGFQTTLGGYITLLLIFISLTLFFPVFNQFLDTSSPTVATSKQITSKINSVNLYEDDLSIPIILGNHLSFIYEFERYATIKLRIYSQKYNANKSAYDFEVHHEFDYVHCENLNTSKMVDGLFNLSTGIPGLQSLVLCPDFKGKEKEFRIFDDFNTFTSRRADIYIYPCSLEDSSECATENELSGLTAWYLDQRKLLKSEDYKKPLDKFLRVSQLKLNPWTTKFVNMGVTRNKVYDDRFEFEGPVLKTEYSSMDLKEEDVSVKDAQFHCRKNDLTHVTNYGDCEEYLSIAYSLTGEEVVVTRSYVRLTTIIGEYGGLMKVITEVLFFLYGFYNYWRVRRFISEHVGGKVVGGDEKFLEGLMEYKEPIKPNKSSSDEEENLREEKFGVEERLRREGKEQENVDIVSVEDGNRLRKAETPEKNERLKVQKSSEENNNNEHKAQIKLEEVLKECSEVRTSTKDVLSKLNFVEFLEEVFMEEHDKILLPMALMKARQQKMAKNLKKELKKAKKNAKSQKINKVQAKSHRRTSSEMSEDRRQVMLSSFRLEENRSKAHPEPDFANFSESSKRANTEQSEEIKGGDDNQDNKYALAYQKLKESSPESTPKQIMKGYITQYLGGYFEHFLGSNNAKKKQNRPNGDNFMKSRRPAMTDPVKNRWNPKNSSPLRLQSESSPRQRESVRRTKEHQGAGKLVKPTNLLGSMDRNSPNLSRRRKVKKKSHFKKNSRKSNFSALDHLRSSTKIQGIEQEPSSQRKSGFFG